MNRELTNIAKKYSFLEKLQINNFVDAIDENRWKVARIIGFKNVGHRHTITLHFDGFPSNWDEDFDLPALNKLAPFRRFTLPYTGPIELHRTIHRPPANLNFQQPLLDLKRISKQDKQKIKPEWVIQTFRGQLFILIDTLLTQNIKLKTQEFELVLKFFESYVEAGISILKFALQKINDISKQNVTEPNIIYVNNVYAIVSSLPQILFNFNSMISSKEKRVKFYILSENSSDQARKKLKSFMKSKEIVELCKGILQYQNPPYKSFPWTTKKQALILLSAFEEQVEFPKITDNREISESLDILYYLRSKQIYSEQTIQNIHIQLVMTLVLNGNFQGKLKGLSELKRFCEGNFSLKRQILKQKILTPQLLNALTDNSTFNGQIFKRSLPIFESAARYDLLTEEVLQRILYLHKDKHELELKSFYSTLADFGLILNQKRVIQFFEEFKKFPLQIETINLIKDYTLNVIKHHPVYKKKYMEPHSGLGLVYLWQIIKQENKSQQIVNQAISAFSVLAGDCFYKIIVEKYLAECFSSIKTGKNVENSLKIIHFCLNKNKQLASVIDSIDKQFSIIDTVIKSMIQSPALGMSNKTIESIFQFLEQVNQFARKKITVDHIKDLWNLKPCQKSLLKFIRKYNYSSNKQKSNDKIVNKKLTPLEMKEIISKIFQNRALMENYTNIDQQSYKAIDEILISYNHKMKSIQYNVKHSIRCNGVNELYGLELYLEISLNCKDQNLGNKALRRFIQFYLRPSMGKNNYSTKTDKVGMWLMCAEKMTKYLDQSSKKYIGYSILFEQIKGRMLSLNIMDPSDTTLTVQIKNSNIKKSITLPICSSLWRLRQLINDQLKLNKTNFDVYLVGSNYPNDLEKQEDFSVALIEVPKDPSIPAVIINESKQTHPHYVAIQEFKANFSKFYAEKIYQSLHLIKNFNVQLICLKILQEIPIIQNLQTKFSKLDIGKQVTWDQVLDGQCRVRMRYQIDIINRVKTQGIPWVSNFIKKGGVEHIEKILRLRNSSKVPNIPQDYQFLTQLLNLFSQLIQFYKTFQPNLPFSESSVIEIMKITAKDRANQQLLSNPIILDYFYQTFITLQEILKYPIDGIKILSSQSIVQVLQFLLFTEKKSKIQQRFPKILQQIFSKLKYEQILCDHVLAFLGTCFSNSKIKFSCRVFFDLLVIMFDNNCVTDNLYKNVLKFIQQIRFAPPIFFDQKENTTNQTVYGWLRITKCLLLKSITAQNQLKAIPETQQKFADFLIGQGLFKEQHRFQSEQCRGQAFDILSILSCKEYVMEKVGTQICPILLKGSWRKQYQWYVKSFKKREKGKQVGLKNLAATCYINSLLQQLFYIKQFRQPLLSVSTSQIDHKQNIAHELQKIFANLKYTNREIYSTQSLCQTFIIDGQPIDPRIQMDVDEFFHTLLDKLQFNLKKVNKQNIIDDVFKGEYSNLVIGQECQHKSDRVEHFLSMRLEIINKGSLSQALTQFIKGEVLQGENAYFCQKCDKKIKAVKRVCVKSLPDVLILTLKRFQFDFDRMEKFKLNSFCQFGQDLDMEPYMKESLYQNQFKLPPENYKYKLKGVVIHYGVSEAGHYTSYIKMENGEWKYFDDDKISNFDVKDLGKQCFGGVDDNPFSDNNERIKNAYLLIYEKVNKNKVGELKTNQSIKSEVDAENINNQQIKIIFDQGLQHFFDTNATSLGKNYLLFVHLVSLRSEKRPAIFKKCFQNCINIFESNVGLVEWYLKQFSEYMIKEFLIFSVSEVGSFVASLLIYAVSRVFNADFIKRCMKCIERRNMVPLNKVFQAAATNNNYLKILNEYSFQEKIMKIIKQDKCQPTSSLTKLPIINSEFGDPNINFNEKKDFKNTIQLLQCIELFKFKQIVYDDLTTFFQRTKKLSVQVSIARFYANKFRDEQTLNHLANKFLLQILMKSDPKPDEEYYFKFVVILMNKLCEVKDQFTKKRINVVGTLYGMAIKQSLEGYKAMKILLEGLFSIGFNNQLLRDEVINYFSEKDNKKFVKLIRDWMKESDRFYQHVKNDKLGYWRKTAKYSTSAQLQRIQNDIKVSPDKYLSLFNSLLQKHKIQFPDLFSPVIKVGEKVAFYDLEEFQYEVIEKTGLTLRIRNGEGIERIVLEDDVNPQRSV